MPRTTASRRAEPPSTPPPEVGGDEGTLRPPASGRGEIIILSTDPTFALCAERALRASGFFAEVAEHIGKLPTELRADVLVLDPAHDRNEARTVLEVLARVASRPAVLVLLRSLEDVRLAIDFNVGVIAVDAVEDLLVDCVRRAQRDRRRPRLRSD